eukprot:CAMPEP_0114505258 /NCGR_PEP_ID=MMETSP0109-20121206/10755_1 /TAXON_ID=29199 /ORGANISM="Chlorarachnion reptans, Strain CCCM449" /LENGTH=429 /DNA_ID=CAMNT_0001683681 /DNA_START=397 /DNA_END=1689 /DNA_ORIENTATION=+
MRAAVLESLEADTVRYVKDMKIPTPGAAEVRVRVKACALDPLDIQVCERRFVSLVEPPLIPGYQISGVVDQTGSCVSGLSNGDAVVAILPLDCRNSGGLAEFVVVNHINVVKKPESISFENAAASLLDGLRIYHLLYYLAYVKPEQFVCLVSGNIALNSLAIQILSGIKGVKVIIVAAVGAEFDKIIERSKGCVVRVVDPRCESVVSCIMEETGGLGVDSILDLQSMTVPERDIVPGPIFSGPGNAQAKSKVGRGQDGGRFSGSDNGEEGLKKPPLARGKSGDYSMLSSDAKNSLASGVSDILPDSKAAVGDNEETRVSCFVPKAMIIRSLAVHGKWITTSQNLVLQRHESLQLAMRSASMGFLFEQVWLLSPRQHGKYLHILEDIMHKLEAGKIRPLIGKVIKLDQIRGEYRHLKSSIRLGKVVVSLG